ncbi:hypothetical protein [Cribrihabitans neustonicus]|uniref:hypothetical protein n=1 Tax=Cribrihabitans neustonicus TaxID=1429085 RepID=UPI003B5902C8
MEDLEIAGGEADLPVAQAGSAEHIGSLQGLKVSEQAVAPGDKILLTGQKDEKNNGLYTVGGGPGNPWEDQQRYPKKTVVKVERGPQKGFWLQTRKLGGDKQKFKQVRKRRALGKNRLLEDQIAGNAVLARIYGFAYEGSYYELPEPTVFMVHGKGKKAYTRSGAFSRAPLDPSDSGVASAEYQVADGIRVWDYDKADYTIRMDVMTGMLEQVLLDVYFGSPGPGISGAKVSGAKVSGAKVSGAKVSGAKVSGAKARGSD